MQDQTSTYQSDLTSNGNKSWTQKSLPPNQFLVYPIHLNYTLMYDWIKSCVILKKYSEHKHEEGTEEKQQLLLWES